MSEKLRECPVCGHRSYIKTPQTDSRRRYHKFECPECKVIITHKYAGDLLRLLDMSERRLCHPKHETVSEWEERTGETYLDDGPVYYFIDNYYNGNGRFTGWILDDYYESKSRMKNNPGEVETVIVANHHGKPEKP